MCLYNYFLNLIENYRIFFYEFVSFYEQRNEEIDAVKN